MRLMRFLILTAMAILLAGCSELQHYGNGSFAPVIDSGRGVPRWLTELHKTRTMSPDLRQQTLEAWERDFRDDPSVTHRMRLVLLLATADDPVGNRRRALKLLNGLDMENAGGDSERELIAILQQYLDEQGQSGRKINILWKQVTEQNQRIEELEQQLQALTTIEQNIQQRENPVVSEDVD